MCKGIEVKIQDKLIVMDIFLIHMAGSNVVIGVQDLKTFGPVTFDFEKSINHGVLSIWEESNMERPIVGF